MIVALLIVWVDDILLMGIKPVLSIVGNLLQSSYDVTGGDSPSVFLGVSINYDLQAGLLSFSHGPQIQRLLTRFSMTSCKPASTPAAEYHLARSIALPTEEERSFMTQTPYRQLVGALLFISLVTRPDITFAVHQLARHVTNFRKEHWTAAKRVLRYLKGTENLGLQFKKQDSIVIHGYADADFASDEDTRKSVSGYVYFFNSTPIFWVTKQQTIVARSSTEAELIALDLCVRLGLWWRRGLIELSLFGQNEALIIYEDNQSCLAMINGERVSSRTKHIDVRFFAVKQNIIDGEIATKWTSTDTMTADTFTKPLGTVKFQQMIKLLGMMVAHI